jgi:hypothetical protein
MKDPLQDAGPGMIPKRSCPCRLTQALSKLRITVKKVQPVGKRSRVARWNQQAISSILNYLASCPISLATTGNPAIMYS